MPTLYPAALDALTNPVIGQVTTSPSHVGQHANANDAIEAIEAELGLAPSGASATVAARLSLLDSRVFNAQDPAYGCTGVGAAHDDTAGISAVLNAALAVGGEAYFGWSSGYYNWTSNIDLVPSSGTQFYLKIAGNQYMSKLRWGGADNQTMLRTRGWKGGGIEEIRFSTPTAVGVVCLDVDADATYQSTGFIDLKQVVFEYGSGGSCIGVRGGISTTGAGDISFVNFYNCQHFGTAYNAGDVAYMALRNNALNWNWYGGAVYFVSQLFTNLRPGGGENGGASMHFYGIGSSHCNVEFTFVTDGTYDIIGGRFEEGKRFWLLGAGGATYGMVVNLIGATIGQYTPADGVLFRCSASTSVTVDGCTIGQNVGVADLTAATFTLGGGATSFGSLTVRNSNVQAADPFYTINGGSGTWRVEVKNCTRRNVADTAVSGFYRNHGAPINGSATWDPASVAAGAQVTTTVTVTGAQVGDPVMVGFSNTLQAMQLTGYVSAADTVTVVLQNGTAGPIDLASGTLRATVIPQ